MKPTEVMKMQEPPSEYPGTEAYLFWAYKTRPRPSAHKDLDSSLVTQDTQTLKQAMTGHWDSPPPMALATLAGLQARITPAQIRERELPDFVDAWGRISGDRPNGEHINESRFRRWNSAEDWHSFYEHTITAIRMLNSYHQPFDVGSLYRWIRYRCEHPLQFHLATTVAFYNSQIPTE